MGIYDGNYTRKEVKDSNGVVVGWWCKPTIDKKASFSNPKDDGQSKTAAIAEDKQGKYERDYEQPRYDAHGKKYYPSKLIPVVNYQPPIILDERTGHVVRKEPVHNMTDPNIDKLGNMAIEAIKRADAAELLLQRSERTSYIALALAIISTAALIIILYI